MWVGAESAKRRIFLQDKFSGPRGPHAVSKAIGRGHWKLAIGGLNPQNLLLVLLASILSTQWHGVMASGLARHLGAFSP
jgi:hypothetical protein